MASNTLYKIPIARSPLSAGPGAFTNTEFDELDTNTFLSAGQPAHCVIYPVSGESCVPTIPSGSMVVVNRLIQPLKGHVVAACVDGLNHIKIFEPRESHLRLVSSNGNYEPIEVREHDDFHMLGVVTGCFWEVQRVFHTAPPEPIYSLKGFKSEGSGFRAQFDSSDGQKLDLAIDRQSMKDGIMWASKALGRKVLNWK